MLLKISNKVKFKANNLKKLFISTAIASAMLFSCSASSASFSCINLSNLNNVEYAICKDATLSKLDEQLAYAYKDVADIKWVKQLQKEWVINRNKLYHRDDIANSYTKQIDIIKDISKNVNPNQYAKSFSPNYNVDQLESPEQRSLTKATTPSPMVKNIEHDKSENFNIFLFFVVIIGVAGCAYLISNVFDKKNKPYKKTTQRNSEREYTAEEVQTLRQKLVEETERNIELLTENRNLKENSGSLRIKDLESKLDKANETIVRAKDRIRELNAQGGATQLQNELQRIKNELETANHDRDFWHNKYKQLEENQYNKTEQTSTDFDLGAYELLGLSIDATAAEIKKRFKTLSAMYHPDKNNSSGLMMQKINMAYNKIK